jgi:hypothetical protein
MVKKIYLVFFLLFSLFFTQLTSCFADNQLAIIGNWEGDIDSYLADPNTIANVEEQEAQMQDSYVSFLKEYYQHMMVDITVDTLTINIEGFSNATAKYKIVSSTGNSIKIQCEDAAIFFIDFNDINHIKLLTEENNVKTTICYLQRVKK